MQIDPNIYFIQKKYDDPYVKRNNAFLVRLMANIAVFHLHVKSNLY